MNHSESSRSDHDHHHGLFGTLVKGDGGGRGQRAAEHGILCVGHGERAADGGDVERGRGLVVVAEARVRVGVCVATVRGSLTLHLNAHAITGLGRATRLNAHTTQ